MFVELDTEPEPPGRTHPWNVSVTNSAWRYYNFREHPELIDKVLEDYKPFDQHQSVQTFYDLLRWINSYSSPFESNDCGLRPPRIDPEPPPIIPFESPIGIHGRFTIFFQDTKYNARTDAIEWLNNNLYKCLRDHVSDFPAVLKIGKWPHFFTEIAKEGHVLQLRFWAWGDSEALAMQNLNSLFGALTGCLKAIAPLFKPTG